MRPRPKAFVVLLTVLATACAARGPSPQILAELGRADSSLREGCYLCLKDAQATYERLAALPSPPGAALPGAFNTTLLLAVRSKELGLPSDAVLAHARDLATRLPPGVPGSATPAALIEAAAAVVGETGGLDPEERQQRIPRRAVTDASPLPQRAALEPTIATSLVAEYLALAIDCDALLTREPLKLDELLVKHTGTPLLTFRVGLCGRPNALEALRTADPRWVDTLYFEGRAAMRGSATRAIDPNAAATLYAAAHDAFPDSFAITLALSNTYYSLGEHEPALAGFDSVLAMAPTHRDAMLGRVINLSYLSRYTEAVDASTRMIDLGTWLMGDAYYWRAWNRYHLKALEPAWDDVERALRLQSSSAVYMLAGLIAYDRTDLGVAIQRFDRSYELDGSNCDAEWMSALVNVDQKAWGAGSPKFTRAMSCFIGAAAQARDDLGRVEGSNRTPTQKARQTAILTTRIETAEERSAQSAFNAAQCYALVGNQAMALNHLEVALAHPKMREKAAALKAAITK